MRYINATELLPRELLEQIQQYVDGAYLYIPRKPENRHNWGNDSGYRRELIQRNATIRLEFARGMSIRELVEKYHLSEKSIGRILREKDS